MRISLFHKKWLLCLGLVIYISNNFCSGQEKYLHFTEVNGLPRNITTCLEQDKYGYLWIGTGNGIVRFDGNNFHSYPELSGMGISYLQYNTHDILWVASDKGLFRYNRLTNYFEWIVEGYIPKIQEDGGEIYFLMQSNIYKVAGDSILSVYNGNNISDFCFSEEGIWFGKSDDGVRLLSRESNFTKITASYLTDKYVSIISKIDDKLFAGCYNGQLFCIQENGKSEQIPITNHYFFQKILKINQ